MIIKDGDVYLIGNVLYLVHTFSNGEKKLVSEFGERGAKQLRVKNIREITDIEKYNGIKVGNYKKYSKPYFFE